MRTDSCCVPKGSVRFLQPHPTVSTALYASPVATPNTSSSRASAGTSVTTASGRQPVTGVSVSRTLQCRGRSRTVLKEEGCYMFVGWWPPLGGYGVADFWKLSKYRFKMVIFEAIWSLINNLLSNILLLKMWGKMASGIYPHLGPGSTLMPSCFL